MKLGFLWYGANKWYDPPRVPTDPANSHIGALLPLLYPDDGYATINAIKPDFALFEKLDAAFYVSGTDIDNHVAEYFADVPCSRLMNPDGGYRWYSFWSTGCVYRLTQLMDLSDLVILPDHRRVYSSVFELLTRSKLFLWRFPYPVQGVLTLLANASNAQRYDIIVPYGPFAAQGTRRNSYFSARIAQEIIDKVDGFNNFLVIDVHTKGDKAKLANDAILLNHIGCKDFTLVSGVTPTEFIGLVARAKLVLNLDWSPAIGRIAADCALAKTPLIATSYGNFTNYIYGDIYTQEPFDVVSPIHIAKDIVEGKWRREWFDLAYERALTLNIPDSARKLKEAVAQL